MYDVNAIRADFPILGETLDQGMRLSYLDNAATTQKPLHVIKASDDVLTVSRDGHLTYRTTCTVTPEGTVLVK